MFWLQFENTYFKTIVLFDNAVSNQEEGFCRNLGGSALISSANQTQGRL